jgi:hypothetical protein
MAQVTRGEIQDILTKYAAQDPGYRKALIKNPKMVLEKQLNNQIPSWLKVKAVEETADTMFVVVPYVPKEGEELPDGALEMVAGGKGSSSGGGSGGDTYTCNDIKGVGTRVDITTNASVF